MKRTQNAEHRTQKKMGKMGDIGAKWQRYRGTEKITNNQDTRAQRITNTGCRKVGEYKGMRGGEFA